MHTEALHKLSGQKLRTDAPIDHAGKGEYFAPTDLLATALGTCFLTVMGITAKEKGWELDEITIEIDKKMGINELVTTICHEMVHVKQYARNEMTDECVQYGAATWKGRKVNPKTTYYDLPWEKEAYRLQDGLALKVWKSGEI